MTVDFFLRKKIFLFNLETNVMNKKLRLYNPICEFDNEAGVRRERRERTQHFFTGIIWYIDVFERARDVYIGIIAK